MIMVIMITTMMMVAIVVAIISKLVMLMMIEEKDGSCLSCGQSESFTHMIWPLGSISNLTRIMIKQSDLSGDDYDDDRNEEKKPDMNLHIGSLVPSCRAMDTSSSLLWCLLGRILMILMMTRIMMLLLVIDDDCDDDSTLRAPPSVVFAPSAE